MSKPPEPFKTTRVCEMCGQYKAKAPFYEWKGLITGTSLIICHRCAMRESFGNVYKQNKKYQKWSKDGNN